MSVYRSAPRDPDLAGLLCLFGSTETLLARWRRQGDWVSGLDEKGGEVVRVPLREPVQAARDFLAQHLRALAEALSEALRPHAPRYLVLATEELLRRCTAPENLPR